MFRKVHRVTADLSNTLRYFRRYGINEAKPIKLAVLFSRRPDFFPSHLNSLVWPFSAMSYILFFNKPNTYPLHWPHPRRFWWCKYGPTLIRRGFLDLVLFWVLTRRCRKPFHALNVIPCCVFGAVQPKRATNLKHKNTLKGLKKQKKQKNLHWQSQSDTITDSINQYIKFFKERKRDQNGRSRLKEKCNAKPRTNFFFLLRRQSGRTDDGVPKGEIDRWTPAQSDWFSRPHYVKTRQRSERLCS